MRLRKLVLRDFGLYRGEQTIDLMPRVKYGRPRPIILVGGHNGAGKTTILDALRLCLYGRLALGVRVTDAEYHGYLRDRIHRDRDSLIQPTNAAVAVEFDYSRAGTTATYFVRRSWEPKGAANVNESLEVLRNGKPLDEVESQFWPDFIRSLIPPGVSQLFFFDGEKIKRLAEGHTEGEALAEAVKALLGLDLVERLQTDLDIYCARQVKKKLEGDDAARLSDLVSRQQTLGEERTRLGQEEQELAARIQLLDVEIARAEERLAQTGQGLAKKRDQLKTHKAELEARIQQTRDALRDLTEGALPLLLCPQLCSDLVSQLEAETTLARWRSSRDEIARALKQAEKRLLNPAAVKKLGLNATVRDFVAAEIHGLIDGTAKPPRSVRDVVAVHDLSDRDRAQIVATISQTGEDVPKRLRRLAKELESAEQELRQVQGALNRVPASEELAPLVKKLSKLHEKHAVTVAELAQMTQLRADLDNEYAGVARAKERLLATHAQARDVDKRVSLAYKARGALDKYLQRLTAAKITELQGVVLECFRRLCRKTELVASLRIDPDTFAVTLLDGGGRVVPREALSAGEKQIFAIALLWALAKVSGRPLPMIIDTPLGRLDSIHRRKLVEHYFPTASHQVIVLSTDTEVDREYVDQLRSSISHTVALMNHRGEWSEAKSGTYFWQEEGADVATAN
ncbi:MAG: DNA sulfur modification protein DndD [Sorangiineae bacterium PRO1]|nr:DNA sulfur modification protein DndD [Sorangiineae bacterium PRO1]